MPEFPEWHRRSAPIDSQFGPKGSDRCRSSVAVATGIGVPPRASRALASRPSVGKQNRTTAGAVAAFAMMRYRSIFASSRLSLSVPISSSKRNSSDLSATSIVA
jgi:hypothetical protein